jgi:hypothetical protein
MIVRLEAECLLGAFVRRVAKIEVDGTVRHRSTRWERSTRFLFEFPQHDQAAGQVWVHGSKAVFHSTS